MGCWLLSRASHTDDPFISAPSLTIPCGRDRKVCPLMPSRAGFHMLSWLYTERKRNSSIRSCDRTEGEIHLLRPTAAHASNLFIVSPASGAARIKFSSCLHLRSKGDPPDPLSPKSHAVEWKTKFLLSKIRTYVRPKGVLGGTWTKTVFYFEHAISLWEIKIRGRSP